MSKPVPLHPSDSAAQRGAEPILRRLLSEHLQIDLAQERLSIGTPASVQVDAVNIQKRILCEIYARIGKPLAAQRKKIAADILKLRVTEEALGGEWKKYLCFADQAAASEVQGASWLARAVAMAGIEIVVLDLPPTVRAEVLAAQRRQTMTNAEMGDEV